MTEDSDTNAPGSLSAWSKSMKQWTAGMLAEHKVGFDLVSELLNQHECSSVLNAEATDCSYVAGLPSSV